MGYNLNHKGYWWLDLSTEPTISSINKARPTYYQTSSLFSICSEWGLVNGFLFSSYAFSLLQMDF